jgi:hypothetical protein
LSLEATVSARGKLKIVKTNEVFQIYMQKFHAVHSCSVTNIAPGIKCLLAVVLELIVKAIQYHINCMICVQVV